MDTMTTPSGTWERLGDKSWRPSQPTMTDTSPRLGWVQPAYGTNAVDYDSGSTYGGLRSLRGPGGLVVLRGLLKASGAISAGATLATMPVGQRPGVTVVFGAWFSSGAMIRIQIDTAGVLTAPSQAFALNDWVTLSGITYTAEG